MYPFLRMAKELIVHSRAGSLDLGETHVSRHICWPWDLDFWMELNNGRTLTLYDLNRIPMARRAGLIRVLMREGWGLTMAGASVRYRRRIRMFDRFEIRGRAIGVDERFFYVEQGIWRHGECAGHILYRAAVTDENGIVPSARLIEALAPDGQMPELPQLPGWVTAWSEAEAQRPWPPDM